MPKKKATTKKTKLAKSVIKGPTNSYNMNQWANVVETEMKRRSWADWSHDQLKNNKLR